MSAPVPVVKDDDDRAIDQGLAHWVLARTGSPLLARAARASSRAEGLGHACAQLADQQTDSGLDSDALDALRQHAWVGDGSIFTPFVLDAAQRFYLWRNWQHETKLAAAILQRCADRRLPIPPDVLASDLQLLFAGMPQGPTDGQRAAVAAAPGARLFVLTGGPGTGKTTTVVRMLVMLLRHAKACGLPAQPSIALAAPTGKAAQRLAQAIAKGKSELQLALGENVSVHDAPSVSDPTAAHHNALVGAHPVRDAVAIDKAVQQQEGLRTTEGSPLWTACVPANGASARHAAEPASEETADRASDCWSDFSRDALDLNYPEEDEEASRVKSLLQSFLPHIPHADARTLHRLLGYQPRDNSFSHDARHPLAADIVVVDEASMVDLAMMRQLFDALRPETVLILLGDPGQLASVEAGSVLADIVASAPQNQLPSALVNLLTPLLQSPSGISGDHAPLAGHVLTLTHSWRAGSGLQRGIEALRDTPNPEWLDALISERADGDLQLRQCADSRQLRGCVDEWIDGHSVTLQSLLHRHIEPAGALQQLRELQILCALREGPFGAQGINALFARRLAKRFDLEHRSAWYHGRPIIVTRNDYARGLFNGDVGIALMGAEGLRVWFEISDRDGNSGLRSYSPRALPAHESAWAITIHRSQGSEYQDVAVVLPPEADHRLLCRELIYTAISRARHHAEVWCTDDALRAALARPIQRQGGLRGKLRPDAH